MELMYPIAIILCLILSIFVCFNKFTKNKKYTTGKKVANTQYIKETPYYKQKIKRYNILSNLIKGLSVACIVFSSILIARLVTFQNVSDDKYNRDIIIGLDISGSQDEVNIEFVKKVKEIIPAIKGDRIGIVIYNTSPVVFCPLTDDYDYINSCLEQIEKNILAIINNNGNIPYDDLEARAFWLGGTLANNDEKGSSLIGDGLAGTLFSFPDLKTDKERTRIIIFATDNHVTGTETVSLEEACSFCKQYNVNVYAYCPTPEMNQYVTEQKLEQYKYAVEKKAGGKFYTGDLDKMSSNIVNEIKETKTSLLKTTKKYYAKDYPEIIFISIIILFLILILIEKRIKL